MIEMYLNVLVSSDVEVSNALVEGTGTGKLSDLKQRILKNIYLLFSKSVRTSN